MKKTLLAICTLLIVSCSKKEEKTEQKNLQEEKPTVENTSQSIEKLQTLLRQFEDQSQFFDISASKPSSVKGKKGTIIHIDPKNLELENGKALRANLKVELKELTNQNDLFRNNTQTVSDGKLLISGGSYFIDITSNGEKVNLKKGKTLAIEFPKITNRNMELFYGERDSLNQMNWSATNTKFTNQTPKTDAKVNDPNTEAIYGDIDDLLAYTEGGEDNISEKDVKKISKVSSNIYETMKVNKLGWINCDAFFNKPNGNFSIVYTSENDLTFTNSYIIFKDMNSVINLFASKGATFSNDIKLPPNQKIKIISFGCKDDKFFTATKEVTTSKNGSVELGLKEVSEKDIEKLFKI